VVTGLSPTFLFDLASDSSLASAFIPLVAYVAQIHSVSIYKEHICAFPTATTEALEKVPRKHPQKLQKPLLLRHNKIRSATALTADCPKLPCALPPALPSHGPKVLCIRVLCTSAQWFMSQAVPKEITSQQLLTRPRNELGCQDFPAHNNRNALAWSPPQPLFCNVQTNAVGHYAARTVG